MLAATWLDPVIGVDTHIVLVPAPPALPVPTPMPHPFVGMVFSALELVVNLLPDAAEFVAGVADAVTGAEAAEGHGAAGAGIVAAAGAAQTAMDAAKWVTSPVGTAIEWVSGQVRGSAEANAGKVKVNGMWAAAGGGSAMATPPHLPMPFPFAIPPDNNAELFFGATGIFFEGHYPVRLLDVAMGCGDPTRMPSCLVMAVPKGYPVVVLRPQSPDLISLVSNIVGNFFSAIGARIWRRIGRIRWVRTLRVRAKRLAGKIARPGHLRSALRDAVCILTGEPIDVATGRVLSTVVEFELPGPIPLVFERRYDSALSWRDGVLGYGWSHSLDQAIWEEPGRIVLREADGRELDFDTLGMPGHRLPLDGSVWSAMDRVRVIRRANGWEVHGSDARVREFVGDSTGLARLVKIRSRSAFHSIQLSYDRAGRLEWVRDSAGRLIHFEHDDRGRLLTIKLPLPHGRGWYVHSRFEFDRNGDLARGIDAAGTAHRYYYSNHLKVKKTDRSGLAFYYEYDGADASARCVRSWGDGGILHRVLHYLPAKRTTIVEDSYGRPTTYVVGETGIVERVTDPLGATSAQELDPSSGWLLSQTDAIGAITRYEWDARGNCTCVIAPDGTTSRSEWDEHDRLVRFATATGAEWALKWNLAHELISVRDSLGATTSYDWHKGLIVAVTAPDGARTTIERDERLDPARVTHVNGAEVRLVHDQLGRLVKVRNALGGVQEMRYDALGREVWRRSASGGITKSIYDAEDNLVDVRQSNRAISMSYSGFHWVTAKDEGGARLRFEHDLEGHVSAVINEAGEHYTFARDARGGTCEEIGFDGRKCRYERDALGRVTRATLPSGRESTMSYDVAGRLLEQLHSDGTFARMTYDAGGSLVRAEAEAAVVEFERDVIGRIIAERVNGHEVRSQYDVVGRRVSMSTSLGARLSIRRDRLGDVQDLRLGSGDEREMDVHFERDAIGNEVARRFGNGIDVEWSHDLAGKTTARRTYRRSATSSLSAAAALVMLVAAPSIDSAGASPRDEIDARMYQWRGENQIAEIMDAATGPRSFDHDARGHVVRERRAEGNVDRAVDLVGNLYRAVDGGDRQYGPGGRLEQVDGVRFEHDEDGNRTLKSTADGDWHYRWDGHGMLREVERPDATRMQFEYDAFSRRVAKRTIDADGNTQRETRFVWDGQSVVHELERDGALTTWHWVPGTFTPLAKEQSGRRWTFATDHLGTPTEMYDELGRLTWKMQLDIFGVARFDEGSGDDCPWRWPGQQADTETGLSYNRHRYFDASTGGCYLSQDPIGFDGGTSFYAYVPDPIVFADPLGLAKDSCRKGAAVVIGETQKSVDEAARILRANGHPNVESMMVPVNQWTQGAVTPGRYAAQVEWNKQWLEGKIRDGYGIVDIGLDDARTSRSGFYSAEREALATTTGSGRRWRLHRLPNGESIVDMRARVRSGTK